MSGFATRLTYANAKQYAQDQLQDGTTSKAARQAERVVRNALKRVATARLWNWYLRKHRVLVRPPLSYTGLSVAALRYSVRKAAGSPKFSTLLRDTSLLLSSHTEFMRVRSVVNSTLALLWSTEPFVGASVAASFAGPGKFVFERVGLPRNFRSPYTIEPERSNYIVGLRRITLTEMNRLKRVWDNTPSDPLFYCFVQNELAAQGPQYELWLWPPPSTVKTIDFMAYFWPEVPTADADLIDWDPNHETLFLRAMDVEAALELNSDERYRRAEPHWRRALRECKASQRVSLSGPAAGDQTYAGSKQYRSDHFIDVP